MLAGMFNEARQAYAEAGQLYSVHLDLLYQCDLDCEHCYLDDKASKNQPTAFWKDVIDQIADLQAFDIQLSGGEITLRKDLLELIAHARSRGLFVHLKTHGGRIDEATARQLAELGVSTVSVSYYSHRPEVHDAITRRPGSHAATLEAMIAMRDAGLIVGVSCVVMERNKRDLAAVRAQCESLGLLCKFDGHLQVAHSGDAFPRDTGLGFDDLVEFHRFDAAPDGGCSVQPPGTDWAEGANCVAGNLNLYVDPEGRVTPCVTWPMPLGDLHEVTLRDIWERSPELQRIKAYKRADRQTCGGCHLRTACDFCMGQAWVEGRDPLAPAESLCNTAHARATAAARDAGRPAPSPSPARPRPFRVLKPAEVAALP